MRLAKNFYLSEFACNDEQRTPVPAEYLDNVRLLAVNLQVLRDYFNKPVIVVSGYRTPKHNKAVGGKPRSQHMKAKAGDIKIPGVKPKDVAQAIEKLIAEKKMIQGGIGSYDTFTHYDVRGYKARW